MTGAGDRPFEALVLGRRRTGLAVAALVERLGGRCLICDDRLGAPADGELPERAEAIEPSQAAGWAARVDMVVPSPGVPAGHAAIRAALQAGVAVVSEIELASRHLRAPMVAVTGTNGKSTTVTLVAAMLERAGMRVFAGGNLGNPLCNAVDADVDICAVEVSSFQLEWVDRFRPRAGALLNVSPDHLDRHGDVDAYARTKFRLFARMGTGDAAVIGAPELARTDLVSAVAAPVTTFGSGPLPRGIEGTSFDLERRRLDRGSWSCELAPHWPLAPHDFANAAAAVELCTRLDVDRDAIRAALGSFEPLAHRLAKVREVGGVSYWNDSKATNVGATIASLEAFDDAVILLVGGVSKGQSFAALAERAARLKLVVVYGESAGEIRSALEGRCRLESARGLREAFATAVAHATPGDAVLLAPACASFDEFGDYAERGRAFVTMVEALGGVEGN